jgi:hypothetical protein
VRELALLDQVVEQRVTEPTSLGRVGDTDQQLGIGDVLVLRCSLHADSSSLACAAFLPRGIIRFRRAEVLAIFRLYLRDR